MEEKVKFRGIFRDKFAEKLADFVEISREFSGKLHQKVISKNGWFCGYLQGKFL